MTRQKLVLSLMLLFLAGCSPHGRKGLQEGRDPLEKMNRVTFSVNKAADKVIVKPVAQIYGAVVPVAIRNRVQDFMQHLNEPNNFINALLQARLADAGKVVTRFVANTVFGVFGLVDMARANFNLPYQRHDFSETLGSWGIKRGPYLVLPGKGPSTFRDTIGLAVDSVMDPLNIFVNTQHTHRSLPYIRTGLEITDRRERLIEPLEKLEETSLDYYTGLKTAYFQQGGSEKEATFDMLDDDGEPADEDYS